MFIFNFRRCDYSMMPEKQQGKHKEILKHHSTGPVFLLSGRNSI
jgi:uncharacterized protein YciI